MALRKLTKKPTYFLVRYIDDLELQVRASQFFKTDWPIQIGKTYDVQWGQPKDVAAAKVLEAGDYSNMRQKLATYQNQSSSDEDSPRQPESVSETVVTDLSSSDSETHARVPAPRRKRTVKPGKAKQTPAPATGQRRKNAPQVKSKNSKMAKPLLTIGGRQVTLDFDSDSDEDPLPLPGRWTHQAALTDVFEDAFAPTPASLAPTTFINGPPPNLTPGKTIQSLDGLVPSKRRTNEPLPSTTPVPSPPAPSTPPVFSPPAPSTPPVPSPPAPSTPPVPSPPAPSTPTRPVTSTCTPPPTPYLQREVRTLSLRVETVAKRQDTLEQLLRAMNSKLDRILQLHQPTGNNHRQEDPPADDNVYSDADPFSDVPLPNRIPLERLSTLQANSLGPGNFAKKVTEELFPELYGPDNLRFRYSYNGGGVKSKRELDPQRKQYLVRYVLYFNPEVKDPSVWKDRVVPKINESLRRPAKTTV